MQKMNSADEELKAKQAELDEKIAVYQSYSNSDLLSKFSQLSYLYESKSRDMTVTPELRDDFYLVYNICQERMSVRHEPTKQA